MGRSRSRSDDGDTTVRLSGRYVLRECIPEDDGTHLSADGFGEGEASTSVLAAVEGSYMLAQTEDPGGDIELQTLHFAIPSMVGADS
jgi:hypothetical protein